MPPLSRKAFDALYSELAALARSPDAPTRSETLARGLASKSSHLIARAAPLVRAEERAAFEPALLAAYAHLFGDDPPGRSSKGRGPADDPTCLGKTALADALDRLEHEGEAPFRRGLRHVQKEGPYPPSDSATGLRARCGLALVRLRVADALDVLADMLADDEPTVRAAGASGVAYHGDERGTALLRLKLSVGDPEPDVVTSALVAYLRLALPAGLERTRALLLGPSRTNRESAALALGEARVAGGLALLASFLECCASEGEARAAVAALLMLRTDESLAHLETFASREGVHAAIARDALARYERALGGDDGE